MNGSTTQLSFERFAALCAAAVGALGVGYSIAFLVFLHDSSRGAAYANAILLLAGGLLATATFVAVYQRVRSTDEGLALWGPPDRHDAERARARPATRRRHPTHIRGAGKAANALRPDSDPGRDRPRQPAALRIGLP
jgi:hypothetical protein